MFKKRKNSDVSAQKSDKELANEYYRVLDLALYRIDSTVDVDEFFASFDTVIEYGGKMLTLDIGYKLHEPIIKILSDLRRDRTKNMTAFFDRLYGGERLYRNIDRILSYREKMSDEAYAYFMIKTGLNENSYRYCKVTFGTDKTYYYLCEHDYIKAGDRVIVPVGENYEESYATVISVEEYTYDKVPYPLDKVKEIIGIVETNPSGMIGLWRYHG